MKKKGSLALVELAIMVLVFALAAAGCLRCFVWAKTTSEDIAIGDQAVVLGRNAAEAAKITQGDPEDMLALVTVPEGLELKLTPLSQEIPGLGEMEITVEEDGKVLFALTAAWQEEHP